MTKALTTGDVARACQVSQATVVNWIRSRGLPAYTTPGGHYRIQAADLDHFAAQYRMPIDWQTIGVLPDQDLQP